MAGAMTIRLLKSVYEPRGVMTAYDMSRSEYGPIYSAHVCTKWARRAGMRTSGYYILRFLRKEPRWHSVRVRVRDGSAFLGLVTLRASTGDEAYIPASWADACGVKRPGVYYVTLRRIPKKEWANIEGGR